MQEEFIYWLPDENGRPYHCRTECNSVVIVGANGSGKSKLGAWIERQNFDKVHRIGAQRKLNFQENITLKSFSAAENEVFYGAQNPRQSQGKYQRWGVQESDYTTRLIDDFGPVLAALLAQQNNQQADYINQCREAERSKQSKPDVPEMAIDKLRQVWRVVFPQRDILVDDSKFYAVLQKGDISVKYPANQMSDGERSVLYLATQVLCVPENKLLIIDEPELHLHKSIMYPLWMELEKCRPDCLFIYITHDTDFAALHNTSNKLWIQEFDGKNWKLELLEDDGLPESLLLEILGSRKDIVFVEGNDKSFDVRLYSLLLTDYHVIPCGNCEQVISRVRAFRRSSQLHYCNVFGIIDLDYRTESELLAYRDDNIFSIEVAEIENLFLTEEVLKSISEYFARDDSSVRIIQDRIIDRFSQRKNEQARLRTISEIKHKLATVDITDLDDQDIDSRLQKLPSILNYQETKQNIMADYDAMIENRNYLKIIKCFNDKKLLKEMSEAFGMKDKDFVNCVLDLLRSEKCPGLREAFLKYIPSLIPITKEASTESD